ncbi:hypothetical protein [Streptomyces sp. NPDC054874]
MDELHDEVRVVPDTRGVHAMHIPHRRVPTLSCAQTIEYVTALRRGDAPAHLMDVATEELVPPTDPVLSVTTIHGAEHHRARPPQLS